MNPVEVKLQNIVLGANQEEYQDLPAYVRSNRSTDVVTCWALSIEDLKQIAATGKIYVVQSACGQPFHPILVSVQENEIYTERELKLYDEIVIDIAEEKVEIARRKAEVDGGSEESATIEFKSFCNTCDRYDVVHVVTSIDKDTNEATAECRVCKSTKKGFLPDLITGLSPEERMQQVIDAYKKDNNYSPVCGACMSIEPMLRDPHSNQVRWTCDNCGAYAALPMDIQ
jgi:transcription elongation factor Elf1